MEPHIGRDHENAVAGCVLIAVTKDGLPNLVLDNILFDLFENFHIFRIFPVKLSGCCPGTAHQAPYRPSS